MFIFGHLGIGSKLVSPWTKRLPLRGVFLGTLLPDLIDKPLYYGLALATGRRGAELGLVCGTRTFAHTALFLIACGLGATARRSRRAAAITLGVASHLLLDNFADAWLAPGSPDHLAALLWPLAWPASPLRWGHFPVIPFRTLGEHAMSSLNPLLAGAELLGIAILAWDYWQRRERPGIGRGVRLLRRQRRLRPFLRGWK